MAVVLENDWAEVIGDELQKPYYLELRAFLKQEYANQAVYPGMYEIFNALHYTPFENTKAVILGQDPYHGANQAHGLSFSVQPGVRQPPSLKNIFKELNSDLGYDIPNHGCLTSWAKEGVMLLNTVLTVRQGTPNSHRNKGWETFTDRVIHKLNEREKPMVFILWGRNAQAKEALIDRDRHKIIKSPHPSPFSANRGFFGSRPFSQTNAFLEQNGMEPIDWSL